MTTDQAKIKAHRSVSRLGGYDEGCPTDVSLKLKASVTTKPSTHDQGSSNAIYHRNLVSFIEEHTSNKKRRSVVDSVTLSML